MNNYYKSYLQQVTIITTHDSVTYTWKDSLGTHEYVLNLLNNEYQQTLSDSFDKLSDKTQDTLSLLFLAKKNNNNTTYSWTDKHGYHQYVCELNI